MINNVRNEESQLSLGEFALYEPDDWETVASAEEIQPSKHLVPLSNSDWRLWRWVCLRGAGFPAHIVLRLAAPAAAEAANQLLAAEAAHECCQAELLETLGKTSRDARQQLSQLPPDDERQEPLREAVRRLRRAEKKLRKGQLPDRGDLSDLPGNEVDAAHSAAAELAACQKRFEQALANDGRQVSVAIREIASDGRFREAVTWQNRKALHTGIDGLLSSPIKKNLSKKARQREELVASYAQRYCAKNDSIGFFGPIGWAQVNPEQPTTTIQPGKELLATRTVYFEDWGLAKLAKTLSQNEALRPWCIPHRLPFSHLDGTTLYLQAGQSASLSAKQAAVLRTCDGHKNARQIAQQLAGKRLYGFADETAVYETLRALADARRLVWELEVPVEGVYPEEHLRQWATTIEDEDLRQQILQPLDELEAARDKITAASGNANQLDQAIAELEATFSRLTGAKATRRAGKMYAARTLVYEDCRRDVDIQIGTDLLQAIERPLSLMLTAARWYTHRAADVYRQAFQRSFNEACNHYKIGDGTNRCLDLATFWLWCHSLLFDDIPQPVAILAKEFQERWAGILEMPSGQRRLHYKSQDLQAKVQTAFEAPQPGWQSARYHSPDIMIAAESIEAIRNGDYQMTLGEMHVGVNTLTSACFLTQHPAQEELFEAVQADIPGPRIAPLASQKWTGKVTRTQRVFMSPEDVRLIVSQDTPIIPGTRAVSIGELVVEESGDTLIVRSRDGLLRFDIIEVFSQFIVQAGFSSFKIVPNISHTPRISFDRLVVAREAWRFKAEALAFAEEQEEEACFLAARRWKEKFNLPRFVFMKAPIEQKPLYVDFDSPLYVRLLAKIVRKTAESDASATITVAEMLPLHEQSWLPDANGQRYTSELRLVAVDKSKIGAG